MLGVSSATAQNLISNGDFSAGLAGWSSTPNGTTTITYDPEAVGRRIKLGEYLGMMGKTRHLLSEENKPILEAGEIEVERRWRRLKAMHEHPLL